MIFFSKIHPGHSFFSFFSLQKHIEIYDYFKLKILFCPVSLHKSSEKHTKIDLIKMQLHRQKREMKLAFALGVNTDWTKKKATRELHQIELRGARHCDLCCEGFWFISFFVDFTSRTGTVDEGFFFRLFVIVSLSLGYLIRQRPSFKGWFITE